MKTLLALVLGTVVSGGLAQAQTAQPGTGYVEGIAQSAFGNATSQSYGAEVGYTITNGIQVFVEGGRTKNVAPSNLGSDALIIAEYLTRSQSGSVTFSVREPVTFVVAGVKYRIPTQSKAEPYVLGGFGVAKYTQDVRFLVGGTDITANLATYGVVLGSDLSGAFTRPLMTLGGGVEWPLWEQVVIDFQYRYGRIFAKGQGISTNRAGIGLGFRF